MRTIIATIWFACRRVALLKFLLILGCLSPIDFPVKTRGGQLVISGQISTIPDQNLVQLGITADTERLPFPVSGASVILRDDFGNSFFYTEQFEKPGNYLLGHVPGMAGRTYFIEVTLDDGNVYRSIPEKMPEATRIDSLYYEVVNEDVVDGEGIINNEDLINIHTNFSLLPPAHAFIKWTVRETFLLTPTDLPDTFQLRPPECYIDQNANPQRVTLFDGSLVSAQSIERQLVASRIIDWSFLERHYFTVYQSSITEESYRYWRQIEVLTNQIGSIFDTAPAVPIGNLINATNPEEKVLGYFQAANQSFERFFLLPTDLPSPLMIQTCNFNGSLNPADYPSRCFDCINQRNSSHIRPVWF